jgi:hypothetical protein
MGPCFRRDDSVVASLLKLSNSEDKHPHSRSAMRPGCARTLSLEKQRAQGMPDARRVRSRVRSVESTRVSHHGRTGNTRHSPRNGFNGLLRALPGDRACLPPSSADNSANLTPASGHQDHTTSPSASLRVRQCAARVHRIPCPTSVTIAKRPFVWDGMAMDIKLIRIRKNRNIFSKGARQRFH